jgi:hypothetical protein
MRATDRLLPTKFLNGGTLPTSDTSVARRNCEGASFVQSATRVEFLVRSEFQVHQSIRIRKAVLGTIAEKLQGNDSG